MYKNRYNIQTPRQIQYFCMTTRAMAGWTLDEMGVHIGVSGEAVRTWEKGMAVPLADKFMKVLALRADIVRAKKRGNRYAQSMCDAPGHWRRVPAEVA